MICIYHYAAWNWYWILHITHRTSVAQTVTISFIGLIRRKVVAPMEIESIKHETFQSGFLIVGTKKGKIILLTQFNGVKLTGG